LLRRAVRAGYRRANDPTAAQLVEHSDDQLFHRVQYGGGHVLKALSPIVALTHPHSARPATSLAATQRNN